MAVRLLVGAYACPHRTVIQDVHGVAWTNVIVWLSSRNLPFVAVSKLERTALCHV